MGLRVRSFLGAFALAGNSGPSRIEFPDEQLRHELPSVLLGGGAAIGYDLSGVMGVVELYLDVSAGVFVGSDGAEVAARLIPVDVSVEKGFYLGTGVGVFLAAGAAVTRADLTLENSDAEEVPDKLGASFFGISGGLGLDILFTPTVALRLGAQGRFHFGKAKYETKDGEPPVGELAERSDGYTMLGGAAGLTVGF